MSNVLNKKGITLVEILISMTILALIATGVMGTIVISVETSKKINYEYTATNLCKNRLEYARALIKTDGFLALTGMEEDVHIDALGELDSEGEFIRKTSVDENYDGNQRLTKVEVEVSYYYRGEEPKNPVIMTTIYTDVE
ncbi:MAG: type II secretion system protein [Candidatus Omnitrophica bacterium]|nr:type II secretion system protein [Candidatus Omnitrophota bacterium]